ncbi:coiled-coil domain-containing protein 39-like [Antennarius striatus]|uniref:coiled-coil domain-containing protein 39-like n=1 Tax=Antennarius striatus TaxID=241820 RepID=UPI0035B078B6
MIEVNRRRDLLYKHAGSMLSLEKQKLDLETAIKSREHLGNSSRCILKKQLKISEQNNQALRTELNDKLAKVKNAKNRFEIMNFSKSTSEGEEERYQVHHIEKAAQETEELKRTIRCLNDEFNKIEMENRAFQDTIVLFDNNNAKFHQSLNRANESSPEFQMRQNLEEQLKTNEQMFKVKSELIQDLQHKLQDLKNTFDSLLLEENVKEQEFLHKQPTITKLNKEISLQQEKIGRATKQCSRLIKEIHSNNDPATVNCEKDIILREMTESYERFKNLLNMDGKNDLTNLLKKRFMQWSCSSLLEMELHCEEMKLMTKNRPGIFKSKTATWPAAVVSAKPVAAVSAGELRGSFLHGYDSFQCCSPDSRIMAERVSGSVPLLYL